MSNESTTKKSTAQKAREAGAKTPDDKKKAASAKLKAMRAEAAEGDVVIELHGETLTVHLEEFQKQASENYEFQEVMASGLIAPLLSVLLDRADIAKLKEIARDPETKIVSSDRMTELFAEVTEAAGQGN